MAFLKLKQTAAKTGGLSTQAQPSAVDTIKLAIAPRPDTLTEKPVANTPPSTTYPVQTLTPVAPAGLFPISTLTPNSPSPIYPIQTLTPIAETTFRNLKDLVVAKDVFHPIVDIGNILVPIYQERKSKSVSNLPVNVPSLENVTLSAYEQITGISKSRPEIISMADFLPLFNDVGQLTDAGEFFNAHLQSIRLKYEAMAAVVRKAKEDEATRKILQNKENDFDLAFREIELVIKTLYSLVSSVYYHKALYRIREPSWKTTLSQILDDCYGGTAKIDTQRTFFLGSEFSPYAHLTSLGFSQEKVGTFSNTKIYYQCLEELNHLLQDYSPGITSRNVDILSKRANDADPAGVIKYQSAAIHADLAALRMPEFDFLAGLKVFQIGETTRIVKTAFDGMERILANTNKESSVALLASVLSREFAVSSALIDPNNKKFLLQQYGYVVQDNGNPDLVDTLIGRAPNRITDISTNTTNMLGSLAQLTVGNGAGLVLPFEERYLDLTNNTYTPGSVYLFDEVFRLGLNGSFSLENILNFEGQIELIAGKLPDAIFRLNFLPELFKPETKTRATNNRFEYEQVASFLATIESGFIDPATRQPFVDVLDSPALPLFTQALQDTQLRALLFLYCTMRFILPELSDFQNLKSADLDAKLASSQYANATQKLSEAIGERLLNVVRDYTAEGIRKTVAAHQMGQNVLETNASVEHEAILSDLKNLQSLFINRFANTYGRLVKAFVGRAMEGTSTAFSGVYITNVCLLLFQLVSETARLSTEKQVIGKYTSRSASNRGKIYYLTNRINPSNFSGCSLQMVKDQAWQEVNKGLGAYLNLLGILSTLSRTNRNFYQTFTRPELSQVMQRVVQKVEKTRIPYLFSEQQIYLLQAELDQLTDRLQRIKKQKNNENLDISIVKNQDVLTDLRLIEDTTLLDARDAFYTCFSQYAMRESKAFNAKLLSVGIPAGFVNNLREKISVGQNGAFASLKENDVIRLNVYKQDLEFGDLVFKPQGYVFELSRFVQPSSINESISGITDFDILLTQMKLRDYSARTKDHGVGELEEEVYDFLSDTQKKELIRNHFLSYFLSGYLKVMTGFEVSEFSLPMDGQVASETLTAPIVADAMVRQVFSQIFGVVSSDATDGQMENLTSDDKRFHSAISHTAAISEFSNTKSVYVDTETLFKKIINPSIFDRIFHILLDPDDFEIDFDKTCASSIGREAFNKLLADGTIVVVEQAYQGIPTVSQGAVQYKLKERSSRTQSMMLEKYFTTIESILEDQL